MSKLNTNKSIINFLKKNSVKVCAVTMLTLSPTFLISCKNKNDNTNISTTITEYSKEDNLKKYIEQNIDNISVVENQSVGGYYIYEEIYKDGNFIGYNQYFIEYSKAENLELNDLLKSRENPNLKIK